MQRYDFDELTKHECDDGEWVKASEAEAVIDVILRNNRVLLDQRHELMQENAKQGAEIARLRKALEAALDAVKPTFRICESCANVNDILLAEWREDWHKAALATLAAAPATTAADTVCGVWAGP